MIQIHRSKPLLQVGNVTLKLSRDEHLLITTLGMMDNRVVPYDFLFDGLGSGSLGDLLDTRILYQKMYRLRRKVGGRYLQCRRWFGYILTGPVRFVDEL
jgi:DNA-binding response OmpR family regulator